MKTFRLTVRAGTFKNLDVTEEDINLAENKKPHYVSNDDPSYNLKYTGMQ